MPIIPKPMETEAQSRSQQKDILTEVLRQKNLTFRDSPYAPRDLP